MYFGFPPSILILLWTNSILSYFFLIMTSLILSTFYCCLGCSLAKIFSFTEQPQQILSLIFNHDILSFSSWNSGILDKCQTSKKPFHWIYSQGKDIYTFPYLKTKNDSCSSNSSKGCYTKHSGLGRNGKYLGNTFSILTLTFIKTSPTGEIFY